MKKNGFAPIIVLFIMFLAIVGYFGYKYSQSHRQVSNVITNLATTPTVFPTPTPFSTQPQPNMGEWNSYTDNTYGLFVFEYPSFMPKPTIYWQDEAVLRYISVYTWQVDKMSFGDYNHNIDLRIQGQYPNSEEKDLIEWIKEQNLPYQEGEQQEMTGSNKITYKTIDGQKMVLSVFTEKGSKYAKSWTLYFGTKKGIYKIDLNIQGTETELLKYQTVFDHILSTFRFTKSP